MQILQRTRVWRSYSRDDRRCRTSREASEEEEVETFLRTVKFRADLESVAAPPGGGMGGRRHPLIRIPAAALH